MYLTAMEADPEGMEAITLEGFPVWKSPKHQEARRRLDGTWEWVCSKILGTHLGDWPVADLAVLKVGAGDLYLSPSQLGKAPILPAGTTSRSAIIPHTSHLTPASGPQPWGELRRFQPRRASDGLGELWRDDPGLGPQQRAVRRKAQSAWACVLGLWIMNESCVFAALAAY